MDQELSNIKMLEILAQANMNPPGQIYREIDDDDESFEDDDEEDDEDDAYSDQQDINMHLNPYGSGGGVSGGHDGGPDSHMQQHMLENEALQNMLQELMMNSAGMEGFSQNLLEDIGSAMENGAGEFLPNMQSVMPGAIAGAFSGAMMGEYPNQDPHGNEDFDEDDLSDEDDPFSDDSEGSESSELMSYSMNSASVGLAGGMGAMMAAGMMTSGGPHKPYFSGQQQLPGHSVASSNQSRLPNMMLAAASFQSGNINIRHDNQSSSQLLSPQLQSPIPIKGIPTSMQNNPLLSHVPTNAAPSLINPLHLMSTPMSNSNVPPMMRRAFGFSSSSFTQDNTPIRDLTSSTPMPLLPTCTSISALPTPALSHSSPAPSSNLSSKVIAPKSIDLPPQRRLSIATNKESMSGGTVSKADPLAAFAAGFVGTSVGSAFLTPILNNTLGNSGGTTVVYNQLDSEDSCITVKAKDSFSNKTLTPFPTVDNIATSLATLNFMNSSQNQVFRTPNCPPLKEDEGDKTSLKSTSEQSELSGGGKSDTESVGKKTPSPIPESSLVSPSNRVSSCISIIDGASSVTESRRDSPITVVPFRDSDTVVNFLGDNVSANLSDLEGDLPDKKLSLNSVEIPANQYGAIPVVKRPTHGWNTLVGLDRAKEALKSLFLAQSFPEVFEGTQGSCKGVLLFGPRHSGKTALAQALAKEANALLVAIHSQYFLGHTPLNAIHLVRYMFDQARSAKPSVILLDGIEALCIDCESAQRVKDEILAQVKGLSTLDPYYPPQYDPRSINDGIMVVATTNQPWLLEDKLRRVFAYNIHVRLPAEKTRHELFRSCLGIYQHDITNEQFDCLVSHSAGYSALDIHIVTLHASQRALELRDESVRRKVTFEDFAASMTQYGSQFNEDLQRKYSSYISAATHKTSDFEEQKGKKEKPKEKKKLSHRIAKSFAAAFLAVID